MSDGNEQKNGQIHQIQLKGHHGPILCLDHSSSRGSSLQGRNSHDSHSNLLMSGSEDGTARLWDLRTGNKASLCILSPTSSSEITSVAFSPPHMMKSENLLSTSNSLAQNIMVYLSCGSDVYGYDLRKASMPIIRDYDYSLSPLLENKDEVNHLVFSPAGKKKGENNRVHLAAADDNGEVRITDCIFHNEIQIDHEQKNANHNKGGGKGNGVSKSCRILQHALDGAALVTSIGFRPRAKGLDLASGGTDCTIHLWDITRPWKPSFSFQIERNDAGTNQVCNPPMVHSLAWSPSGKLLASGLGDGSCSILSVEGRRLLEACRLKDSHDAAVACVLFPNFGTEISSHITAEDRLLVSAGNDGAIFLWDLGADISGKHAVDPSAMFHGCESYKSNANHDSPVDMSSLSLDFCPPKIIFGIPHQKKPNWIVNSNKSASALPTTLFVADVSNEITAYILPYQ